MSKSKKKDTVAEIKEAEKMFSEIPESKRDLLVGVLLGMELAEQTAKTA